jgi:hypothetical protein
MMLLSLISLENPALATKIVVDFQAHLARLGIWALLSILLGLTLSVATLWIKRSSKFWQHFALQFLSWGIINLIIVFLARSNTKAYSFGEFTLAREFLIFNEGLNIAYIAVGLTLVIVARRMATAPLSGAGWAVIFQGLALLVLDTILLLRLPSPSDWILAP